MVLRFPKEKDTLHYKRESSLVENGKFRRKEVKNGQRERERRKRNSVDMLSP